MKLANLSILTDFLRRESWSVSMEAAGMIFASSNRIGEKNEVLEWCISDDGSISVHALVKGRGPGSAMVPMDGETMRELEIIRGYMVPQTGIREELIRIVKDTGEYTGKVYNMPPEEMADTLIAVLKLRS